LLKRKPLTACEICPSWDSSGWLADQVVIFPNKKKKQTFENFKLQENIEQLIKPP
jgi:hypothetical protein